jgi:flagellar biosynthesis/type III secretory pathway M-ring protein FliF/YscJ
MKDYKLLDAVGGIDPKYIESAEKSKETKKTGWFKWVAMAACLCLVVVATIYNQNNINPTYNSPKDDIEISDMNQQESMQHEKKGNEGTEIPVDEDTYSEARIYSSEILDLQNRISNAMTNNELPFVTTSEILENPDRVRVTVTTTDEEAIKLLKTYDKSGKLLEIEYSVESITDD